MTQGLIKEGSKGNQQRKGTNKGGVQGEPTKEGNQ